MRFPYPGNAVLHEDHAVGYLTGALRAGVWATRKHLHSDAYASLLKQEIPVEMDAPMEGQRYPYVHVMYRDRGFEPASLEETRFTGAIKDDERGHWDEFHMYRFDGTYMVNIYATTILERETIADILIGAMGVDDAYRDLFYENPYINVAPNMHTLSSPTSNESWGTPWDKDVMTAFRQLSFDVYGEFYYRVGHKVEYVEAVDVRAIMSDKVPLGYREGRSM